MVAVVCSLCGVGAISSIGINFQKERSGGLERWISMRSSWYDRIQLYSDACKQLQFSLVILFQYFFLFSLLRVLQTKFKDQ